MIYANVPLVNLEDILDMRLRITEFESLMRFHLRVQDRHDAQLAELEARVTRLYALTHVSRETEEASDASSPTLF